MATPSRCALRAALSVPPTARNDRSTSAGDHGNPSTRSSASRECRHSSGDRCSLACGRARALRSSHAPDHGDARETPTPPRRRRRGGARTSRLEIGAPVEAETCTPPSSTHGAARRASRQGRAAVVGVPGSLYTTPSFMTKITRSATVTSRVMSPGTATMSAILPAVSEPN